MKFCLTAFLVLFTLIINAQHYNFKNYTVADGLAQSQVTDLCQDQHGYLWIGTVSGLSRFNGVEFVNYSIEDGLPDNNVRRLYVGKKGELWVATPQGIAKFENQKIKSYYFNDPKKAKDSIDANLNQYRINSIAELNGEVYFGSTTGLIQIKNEGFVQLGNEIEQEYYFRSIVNYKDSILICGSNKGIFTWDGNEFNELKIPAYDELSVRDLEVKNDRLYVGARNIGLFTYSLSSKIVEPFSLNHTTVSDIVVDEEEIFGITTNAGAFLIRNDETIYFDASNGLMGAGLDCVFRDSEGNIWLGTDGSGLLKFSGTSVVSYTTKDKLGSDLVLSIQQDKTGAFIFGTYDMGVTQFKNGKDSNLNVANSSLADNTVWTIMCDSLNQIWIGTSRGLTILDENNQLVNHALETLKPKIRTMLSTPGGKVLIGGDEGIFILEGDSVFNLHSELNINKLILLNNKLFCATTNGLFEFEENYLGYSQISLPETKINSLTVDQQNNLWIGTENGLFVMTEDEKIHLINLDISDYRSKKVLGLITSKDGSVWISGMKGVFQITYDSLSPTNYTIYNYGIAEGLLSEEANINALYEDFEGEIWVGTSEGLGRINPAKKAELFNYKPPLLHITGFRLFMEKFDYENYKANLDSIFNVPISIEFPHDKNHLTFDFIGINLKDPESVQYEYRLIGVSKEWSPLAKSTYATYSFLQPGNYIFQVRAMNKNKNWSPISEIKVIINPPFWKTWWFIGLVIVGGFLIVVYIFRIRISALKQKQNNEKLDLRNRLLYLEQRSLNASMNRHFIFNSLNSIQYFINSSDKLSANRYLSNFAKLIRKNLDSSAANNFIVTLQEEIERIELYLKLEKMRFTDKFDYTIDVSSALDTESIEIPSMILQPFVENSIIHGVLSLERKGEINIKVYSEFGEVVFEVADNGMGIDNSMALKKETIAGDHESKGVEITNRRIELLRKLTGENMLIVGPYQLNDENNKCLGTKVILKLGGSELFED